ncbi:hypothetical protein AMTR_s00055p00212900 [Amborella trichopoda]|uniref:Uncharacterized protein n=1 Tax=Amborella trichopoda TaxID=13333 RepID=U5D7Y9_AMBTC|nr:hypothetical protein AMTR_s00055p00212900 [Amborella trichopoda]
MVASIAEARPDVRGPTATELVGPCLEAVVHDVDKHIAQFKVETTLLDRRFWALYNHVVSVTEPLVRVLRLSDSDDKPAIGFLLNAIGRAREAIFDDNIWNEEILEIIDRRWRDQLHEDIHAADDADIMEGERNCIYRLEPDLETQMESMQ